MTTDHILRKLLTILCIQLTCLYQVSLQGEWGYKLFDDLLNSYNVLERPVRNESEPTLISFGLSLMQIIDVDEKNQILITRASLSFEWIDYNLRWNPADYGNISTVRIPPHRIWKPDILMFNSADEQFDGTYQTNVIVRKNGSCTYTPPGIFKSACAIDVKWFPFDEQKCVMQFRSWTYGIEQVDLHLNSRHGGHIEDYTRNGEWSLKGIPAKRNVLYSSSRGDAYVDITFVIHIQRRTLYYLINLLAPFLLITSLALFGFVLPSDSRERLSLGLTILLSMTVFLNMVAETMPVTSDSVPLLGTYFNCIMFMIAVSVLSTIISLNYHFRTPGTHKMSRWVRVVFSDWLPWFLRMNRPDHPIIIKEMALTDDGVLGQTHELNLRKAIDSDGISGSQRELSLILKEIRLMNNKIRKDDADSETRNEWKFVAMVIDRFCLIFFTLFTIFATVYMLASAPHIFVP